MTERVGKHLVIIAAEKSQQCDACGKVDELRPYGPNNSMICFDCGMKDKEGTERRMSQVLFGEEP